MDFRKGIDGLAAVAYLYSEDRSHKHPIDRLYEVEAGTRRRIEVTHG
jgi:hypothetical protein